MAYVFHQDELPALVSVVPGRERTFFVNKELTKIDDMLGGVMRYKPGATSPMHYHENCEQFNVFFEGTGTMETEEGIRPVGPGTVVFMPEFQKHRLKSDTDLFYFEFQAPNRFKTIILEGTPEELRWERKDGGIWVQS